MIANNPEAARRAERRGALAFWNLGAPNLLESHGDLLAVDN
jgi:hypothetical protein